MDNWNIPSAVIPPTQAWPWSVTCHWHQQSSLESNMYNNTARPVPVTVGWDCLFYNGVRVKGKPVWLHVNNRGYFLLLDSTDERFGMDGFYLCFMCDIRWKLLHIFSSAFLTYLTNLIACTFRRSCMLSNLFEMVLKWFSYLMPGREGC